MVSRAGIGTAPSCGRAGCAMIWSSESSVSSETPSTHLTTTPIRASAHDRVTGVDVRIDRVGSGTPLVFLNGLLGLNMHWFNCLGPLAERHECILLQPPLLEMRGKGCSVEGQLRLTLSLVETLIDQPAVFLGNSLGGHLCLRMALSRPDLMRGFVLIGSSGLFERSFERDVQHNPSHEWLDRKIRDLFHNPDRVPQGAVDHAFQELQDRRRIRAFVKLGKSAKSDHLGDQLPLIETPALIAWGENDNVTPPSVARQFHEGLPNSRLEWIRECGHAPQLERPVELTGVVMRFLDDLAAGVDIRTGAHGQANHPGAA